MVMAIQSLPFRQFQQHVTGQVWKRPGLHGQKHHPPGDHGIDRQAATQTRRGLQLQLLDLAAALENFEKEFNLPNNLKNGLKKI